MQLICQSCMPCMFKSTEMPFNYKGKIEWGSGVKKGGENMWNPIPRCRLNSTFKGKEGALSWYIVWMI